MKIDKALRQRMEQTDLKMMTLARRIDRSIQWTWNQLNQSNPRLTGMVSLIRGLDLELVARPKGMTPLEGEILIDMEDES